MGCKVHDLNLCDMLQSYPENKTFLSKYTLFYVQKESFL